MKDLGCDALQLNKICMTVYCQKYIAVIAKGRVSHINLTGGLTKATVSHLVMKKENKSSFHASFNGGGGRDLDLLKAKYRESFTW